MNINFLASPGRGASPRLRDGSTVLIIMALLACMVLLLAANTTTLHVLKQELKQIDEQQQRKYGQSAPH